LLVSGRVEADQPTTWAFDARRPPAFTDDTFGLAARNEAIAGEHGWIRVGGNGDFVRGDGQAIRFWCATTYVQTRLAMPELKTHVRALAVRGVNMLRHHAQVSPADPRLPIETANEREVDGLLKLVAAAKREGIYVTFSPYWARGARDVAAAWKLEGHVEGEPWGMLFYDTKLQAAYKAWLRETLLRPNPYDPAHTPLASDPTLAIIQIQNEDSLLFGTAEKLRHTGQYPRLDALYGSWRLRAGLQAGVPLDLRLHGLDEASEARRASVRFLAETMRNWNREVERFLREEIRYRGLVNAGNWKTADNLHLLDLERWTYTVNQVDAVNRYVNAAGHLNPRDRRRSGYRIEPGDLIRNHPPLRAPGALPFAVRQTAGRPFLITESGWVAPAEYRAEGPLLVAAYSSLLGLDGFYWFRLHHVDFDPGLEKWGTAPPDVLGGWPGAALLYRRGDVRRAPPSVRESRTRASVFHLAPPALAENPGFDPNRDVAPESTTGRVDPFAHLVGPAIVTFDAPRDGFALGDLAGIQRAKRLVRSSTGEIELDWGVGAVRVDTPNAQGAAGFLRAAGPLTFRDVAIRSDDHYAAVLVVSLDDRPLSETRRALVQVTTRARPTGWTTEPTSSPGRGGSAPEERIVAVGGPPWRIWNSAVRLAIRNDHLSRGCRVDPHLQAGEQVAVIRGPHSSELVVPPEAMYVLLEAKELPAAQRRCSAPSSSERAAQQRSGQERKVP
jgi:hypothetical protein